MATDRVACVEEDKRGKFGIKQITTLVCTALDKTNDRKYDVGVVP
jgi:hypothetical protein